MSKRIYLSGNTINCYENFTLVCTKDFDNTYFTDDYSLVNDEEYFDAEFESLEVLEDSYESKIEELNDRIADLESKLAESEKKHLLDEKEWQDYCAYKYIEPQIKGCLDREWQYEKKIEELKQQLAEKEKEIQSLKKKSIRKILDTLNEAYKSGALTFNEMFACDWIENTLKEQLAEKDKQIKELTECNQYLQIYRNQDKISLALEQLEKVKEAVKNVLIDDTSYDEYNFQEGTRDDCVAIIDNQIKQLKEME